jgi:hypothetical protein
VSSLLVLSSTVTDVFAGIVAAGAVQVVADILVQLAIGVWVWPIVSKTL